MSDTQKLIVDIGFVCTYVLVGWSICYFGLYKPVIRLKDKYIEELRSKK